MGPYVRRIETIVPRRGVIFGGKARNLAALVRAGFPVPAAYAVSAEACESVLRVTLAESEQPGRLLRAPARELAAERLAELAERVRRASLPRTVADDLRGAFAALRSSGAQGVAVRSSSMQEDEDARSAAGLHDTVLGVDDEDSLFDAVRACWASSFDIRVISYLRALGVGRGRGAEPGFGMGVIVQALVPADVAGVLFTVNPLAADEAEMVLNASYGLGKTVVDGTVSPDTYRIDRGSRWVSDRVVGDKAISLVWSPSRGLVEEAVPESVRTRAALGEDQLERLVDIGLQIEDAFRSPRDIEWAIVRNRIYILQARPITAIQSPIRKNRKLSSRDRSRIVWSNVNVGEALPGVVTPLTWSVLSGFSERGFRYAFGSLGCTVPRDAELVGNFRGRIYLNLSEFMSILSQVPGLNPRALLELGGGGQLEALESSVERRSPYAFLARLPATVGRYGAVNFDLGRRVAALDERFGTERTRITTLDFRLLSSGALDRVLHEVERLLDPTGQALLQVYGNLLASVVVLRTFVRIVEPDDGDALFRDLLSGLWDVDSAVPGLELLKVATIARSDLRARNYLVATAPRDLELSAVPVGPTRDALLRLLDAHGWRGASEAELASPRWREDPSLILSTLRLHLVSEHEASLASVESRQREVRRKAQLRLRKASPPLIRSLGSRLLRIVQYYTRLREHVRGHVVAVLGLYRAVALDASRRLQAMEPGCGPDGAFFLTIDELHGLLRGEIGPVSALIRRRRSQFARDERLPAAPGTFVGFPPPDRERYDPDNRELRGLAASSGHAVGVARVVKTARELTDFQSSEILVVRQADVGWTPVFLTAKAVVAELGGPLSHAAVVAREYGVPAVVNVQGVTERVRTGMRIEVDGDRGVIRLLGEDE